MKIFRFTATLFILAFFAQLSIAQSADFFDKADSFFKDHVTNGAVDYASVKKDPRTAEFVSEIANTKLNSLDRDSKLSYLINAYNLLVISQVVEYYPIASVQETGAFFEQNNVTVGGKKTSLNKFEKEEILPAGDGRLHFVLVCGALGCPPITNFAYTPNKLEQQLECQTKQALNDPAFLTLNNNVAQISKIFEWYATDFGSNKQARINFINKYSNKRLPSNTKFKYVDYDWALNESGASSSADVSVGKKAGANQSRYVTSSAIRKGTFEIKLFNNLFTQRTNPGFEASEFDFPQRNNFFTSTFSALYGLNNRFNVGFEFKYRRVSNAIPNSSALGVLSNSEGVDVFSRRARVTGIGPKIRWAPIPAWSTFSLESTLQLPVGDFLTGRAADPANGIEALTFIDWDGVFWNTQFFNDVAIGTRFSLFTELDFFFEDLGSEDEGRTNRFSTPFTAIFSYFPNPKTTIYALGNYSPIYLDDFSYFYQYGVGFKYQFTSDFELELLVTDFTTQFTDENDRTAATFNIGLRYSIQ